MIQRAADITHTELAHLVGGGSRTILEIGSNDGEDTAQLLKHFPAAAIFCFECDPRAIAKFKARGDCAGALLAEIALDNSAGKKQFHQSTSATQWDKSGSLCRPTGHVQRSPEITFDAIIEVQTERLDDWADQMLPSGVIDLIWIDVQGAEKRVFDGGKRTLARTRFVKTECHREQLYEGQWTEAELLAFFAGWNPIGRFGDDVVLHNPNAKA